MEYFVYTRTRDIDYKLMFSPSEELCPSDIRQAFIKEVRGIINVETYDGCLETPTWYFSRKNGIVLFGVGINNKDLNEVSYRDFAGRDVRGFFGIIGKNDDFHFVPKDLMLFKNFYQKYILPLWECSQQSQFKQKGIIVSEDLTQYESISASNLCDIINTDVNNSVVYGGDVSLDKLFSEALSCSVDTSVVGELSEICHAFDSSYRYMNCKVAGNNTLQKHVYVNDCAKSNLLEDKEHKNEALNVSNGIKVEEASKKVLSPKIIALILFLGGLVSLLIMIKNCSKE